MAPAVILILYYSVLLTTIQGYNFSGSFNTLYKHGKIRKINPFVIKPKSVDRKDCYHLASVVGDFFVVQNNLKPCLSDDYMKNAHVVVILYHNPTWKLALKFQEDIFKLQPNTEFLYYNLEVDETLTNSLFFRSLSPKSNINSVVIFAENNTLITEVLEYVSSSLEFRWTAFLHISEWILVTSSTKLFKELKFKRLRTDFLTLIFSPDCDEIVIAQKSRTESLHIVLKLLNKNNKENRNLEALPACTLEKTGLKKIDSQCGGSQFLNRTGKIRPHALRYLAQQKSILAGFHLSVSILPVDDVRALFRKRHRNITLYDGFSVALLNVLKSTLGFTYELTCADDNGYYGAVNDDGTVNGITGQLARREAALTTMPMSWIENRQQAIDFVRVPTIVENVFNIIYRLPKDGEHLDMTYIDIVQTDLLLLTLGPILLLGFVAGLTHVATKSCVVAEPEKYSNWEFRRLYSCPEHMCFQSRKVYESQTGRILKASWGLFCLILGGAYSAHLVTTFTITPKELSITTFEELLDNSEYKFGVQQSQTALLTTFKTAKDPTLKEIWKKLVQFNKTDPGVFSANLTYQIKKIFEGRYAFIHPINTERMSQHVTADYSDIRIYNQRTLDRISYSYVAVPKNTFYQEELYVLLLYLEESGLLRKLKDNYNLSSSLPGSSTSQSKLRSHHQPVTFYRIQLLVYVVASGIGLGVACLCGECLCQWCYGLTQGSRKEWDLKPGGSQ